MIQAHVAQITFMSTYDIAIKKCFHSRLAHLHDGVVAFAILQYSLGSNGRLVLPDSLFAHQFKSSEYVFVAADLQHELSIPRAHN